MNYYTPNKVALLLTGHFRTHKKLFEDLKRNLLDIYNCDIYISTWNVSDHLSNQYLSNDRLLEELEIYSPWVKFITINNAEGFFEHTKNYMKSKNIPYGIWTGEGYKLYHAGITPEDNINRLSSQWYAVEKACASISNCNDYDVIIRNRFDVRLLNKFKFLDKDLVVPGSHAACKYYNVRDYIVYGKPVISNLLTSMYDKSIETFIKYSNFSAETMMEYCFKNNNLGISLTIDEDLKYGIDYLLDK
jgi:hypothetical protein